MKRLIKMKKVLETIYVKQIFIYSMLFCPITQFAQNLILNPDNELPLVGGEIPNWTEVSGTSWTTRSLNPTPQSGSFYFYPGSSSTGAELRQDIDVSSYSSNIDNNNQSFSFNGYVRDWTTGADLSRITVEYRDAANSSVLTDYDSGYIANPNSWLLLSDTRTAPSGTRFIRIRLRSRRVSGGNNDGYYDNLSLTTSIVLPVELIEFKAKAIHDQVNLNWTTASEANNSGFEIQQSSNGKDWEKINFVEGQGTTTETNEYRYKDLNPFSGINYYRLRQIDFDGAFEYSKVISVDLHNSEKNIRVFPNPSSGLVNMEINNPSNQKIKIKVLDNLGRLVWESEIIEDQSNWRRELEIKRAGIYFIAAQIGREVYYQRVVITNEK